jgi:F-type H+-transporting ATPase subunit gamma
MKNAKATFAALTVGTDPEEIIEIPVLDETGIILFGSAHGLCGQFNQEIVRFTVKTLDSFNIPPDSRNYLVIGDRAKSQLSGAGVSSPRQLDTSGSVAEIPGLLHEALSVIDTWTKRAVKRVYLFFNRTESKSSFAPAAKLLVPIDPNWVSDVMRAGWLGRSIPTFDVDGASGLRYVSRQYFFVTMYQAFLESLASENASRLAAMQAAENNIEDQLDELRSQYNRMRQGAITEELLDITAGFEALTGGG